MHRDGEAEVKWALWGVAGLIAFTALIIAGYYFLIAQGDAFSMSI